MADQFIAALIGEVQGLGYSNVVAQSSPARKEWNTLPLVTIVPLQKTDVMWHAFNEVNIRNKYQIFMVDSNEGQNVADATVNDFITTGIAHFMPMPSSLSTLGAWNIRVVPLNDFDRGLFPAQYIVTAIELHLEWIQ